MATYRISKAGGHRASLGGKQPSHRGIHREKGISQKGRITEIIGCVFFYGLRNAKFNALTIDIANQALTFLSAAKEAGGCSVPFRSVLKV